MNELQKTFRESAVIKQLWKISAVIFLITVSVATMRSLAVDKNLNVSLISHSSKSHALNTPGSMHAGCTNMLFESKANFQSTNVSLSKGFTPDETKMNETKQMAYSKTNPDCLKVDPIIFHGPDNNLDHKTCAGFARELDAVVAAMNEYNPLSVKKDREYMGVIYKRNDRYYYSVTPGQSTRGEVSVKLQRWVLERTTALWHTHGSFAIEREYFSDTDTQLANSLGKRFYLGDATGNLRVFRPGDKVYSAFLARKMKLPNRRGFATGEIVENENGQAVRIANGHPVQPADLKNNDDGFLVRCIRKSS